MRTIAAPQLSLAPLAAPRRARSRAHPVARSRTAALGCAGEADVHATLDALLHEDGFALDVRSAVEYEREHLTKPPRRCVNVPYQEKGDAAAFALAVSKALGKPLSKRVLVFTSDGVDAAAAAGAVAGAGYTAVSAVGGGWAEWRRHYTATCRPAPPKGRWVATGTEALKSGLNVGDAAESYEEKINVQDLTKPSRG